MAGSAMTIDEYRALVASQQLEHGLQLECTRWLGAHLGPNVAWSAIDHAAKLTKRQGAERKRRGVKTGLGDYVFVIPPNGQHGEIELKRPTRQPSRSRQSQAQLDWEAAITASGALYVVCRSLPEVIGTLKVWGLVAQDVRVAA